MPGSCGGPDAHQSSNVEKPRRTNTVPWPMYEVHRVLAHVSNGVCGFEAKIRKASLAARPRRLTRRRHSSRQSRASRPRPQKPRMSRDNSMSRAPDLATVAVKATGIRRGAAGFPCTFLHTARTQPTTPLHFHRPLHDVRPGRGGAAEEPGRRPAAGATARRRWSPGRGSRRQRRRPRRGGLRRQDIAGDDLQCTAEVYTDIITARCARYSA
jgi:hypothetical protein